MKRFFETMQIFCFSSNFFSLIFLNIDNFFPPLFLLYLLLGILLLAPFFEIKYTEGILKRVEWGKKGTQDWILFGFKVFPANHNQVKRYKCMQTFQSFDSYHTGTIVS